MMLRTEELNNGYLQLVYLTVRPVARKGLRAKGLIVVVSPN